MRIHVLCLTYRGLKQALFFKIAEASKMYLTSFVWLTFSNKSMSELYGEVISKKATCHTFPFPPCWFVSTK